jgi:ribosomal protein L11 methyltransferase
VWARDGELAERAAAEAFAAGASGIEERSGEGRPGGTELLVYAPAAAAAAVARGLARLADEAPSGALRVSPAEPAPDEDWSVRWRAGLRIVRISPRLAVRPPFLPDEGEPPALVIDPGQAFGTGGHASTRLALAGLDALGEMLRGARVLDAGTGSGVLALAALALGARSAVGFDLDPVAVREARSNAERNGFAARLRLFAGGIDALRAPPFDVVVANLLRSELLPILPGLASALRERGAAVFAGLLASEQAEVEAALARAGLSIERAQREEDPTGDLWLGLVTRR